MKNTMAAAIRTACAEDIPLWGRIVAVADVFDALTSSRPYKPAWPLEKARHYLESNKGSHFDPACVEALFALWPEVMNIRQQYADEQELFSMPPTPPGAPHA
jgi:putative two-component system response regulator